MKTASIIIAAFIMLAITLNWFRYVQVNSNTYFDRLTRCSYTFFSIRNDVEKFCPIDTWEEIEAWKKRVIEKG